MFKGKALLIYFPLIIDVIIVSPKKIFFLPSLPQTPLFSLYGRCIFQSILTVVVVVIVTDVDDIIVTQMRHH